jgi:hypothetical protein
MEAVFKSAILRGHRQRVSRCLEILKHARAMYSSSDLIFPGTKLGSALSDMTFTKVLRDIGYAEEATPHGMRSAFKVWCAEVAKVRDEVSEAALAHTVRDNCPALAHWVGTGTAIQYP